MVDVEKHALRSLEQDALSVAPCLIQVPPNGPRERKHEAGDLGEVAL